MTAHPTYSGCGLQPDRHGSNNGTVSGATIVDTAPDVLGATVTITNGEAASGEMTSNDITGTATYSVSGGTVASGISTKATTNGTVSIDATSGAWVYTPNANFAGTDTFTLTAAGTLVSTSAAGTDSETITVTVTDPGPASTNVHGGALQLDGTNDYVDLATITGAQLSGAVAIEAWVNFNSFSSFARIVNLSNGNDGTDNIALYIAGTTGKLSMNIFKGATLNAIVTSTVLATDTWYHVAGVTDGTNGALYINGVAQNINQQNVNGGASTNPASTSATLTGANAVTRTTNFIGKANEGGTTFMDGQIDEVRIWNDARTEEEILANYNRQLTGSETDLTAYYRFDDDQTHRFADNTTKISVDDLTSNSIDGTLTGGARIVSTLGKAMSFDGTDDFVNTGTIAGITTGKVTVEGWVKLEIFSTIKVIFSTATDGASAANDSIRLQVSAIDGVLVFATGNASGTEDVIFTTSAIALNEWVHVAAVTDGTANGAAIYFNGVAQSLNGGDATLNGPTSVSRGFSRIGNVTSNPDFSNPSWRCVKWS